MNAPFFRNWSNQIHKGLLELDILNDIHNRRTYAYEIERKFRKSGGPQLSRGAIYKILKRFKQQRLVKTTVMKSPDGPKRKCYQLTVSGFEVLTQMNSYWLAIKQQTDSVRQSNR
jgi:PadR family transcriptional regulator PadR